MTKMADLTTTYALNWCPGCGNFPLWLSYKNAAVKEDWNNFNTVLIAGIGCHGHLVNFTKLNSFEGLHGRALPLAAGVKMSNSALNVFVFTGDGDCLGEGGNHFIHTARWNHDMTVILHDNGLYALTTGQTSPLTPYKSKTKSTPQGNPDNPLNPVALAIAVGATFVARAYASEVPMLTDLIVQANKHKGFALIDVLQPCETFNKEFTHQFFQQNTYHLPQEYDPTNKMLAFEKAQESGLKQIPLGVIYREEGKPTFEDNFTHLANKPLIDVPVKMDMTEIFKKYC